MGPRTGERVEHGDVRVVLSAVRLLARQPRSLDRAIGALEELNRSLRPTFDWSSDERRAPWDPLRTVLSTHLHAVQALRDVEASDVVVTRLVWRAIDGAEELVRTSEVSAEADDRP